MITKEEFEKAVKCCASYISDCDSCPLCASDKHRMCSAYLAEYIKNEPAPVIKNIPSVESNTNTIYENAKITDVSLEIGDHCCLTFSIALKGLGWGASFGGYNLAFFNGTSFEGSEKGLEALTRIMDVVGVAKWEDIKGHYVRVKQEDRLVIGIGNIIKDKWFEPREFFKENENE